jgi:hypothetical protein
MIILIEDGEEVLDRKLAVKLGTSLAIVACYLVYNYPSSNVLTKKELSTHGTSKEQQIDVQKKKSLSQDCEAIKQKISILLKDDSQSPSWINYYLKKGGHDFVLRVEKDTNAQEKEISRIKFYQLDEDGFPTPYSKYHNQELKNEKNLLDIKEGFTQTHKSSVRVQDNYLIEKENDKIVLIKDQSKNENCSYTSQD